MIVTFCGHSEISDKEVVRIRLIKELAHLLSKGCRTFYLGGYGDFDWLAAVLYDLRECYTDLQVFLILPYPNSKADLSLYDATIYPPLENIPKRFAISHRNRWMVENSSILVAYIDHSWGGAAKTLEYAVRKGLQIISIGSYTYSKI